MIIVISKFEIYMRPALVYRRGAILRGVNIGGRAIPLLDIRQWYDFRAKAYKIPEYWFFNYKGAT